MSSTGISSTQEHADAEIPDFDYPPTISNSNFKSSSHNNSDSLSLSLSLSLSPDLTQIQNPISKHQASYSTNVSPEIVKPRVDAYKALLAQSGSSTNPDFGSNFIPESDTQFASENSTLVDSDSSKFSSASPELPNSNPPVDFRTIAPNIKSILERALPKHMDMSSASRASLSSNSNPALKSSLDIDSLSQKISFEYTTRPHSSETLPKKSAKLNVKRISLNPTFKSENSKPKSYRNSPLNSNVNHQNNSLEQPSRYSLEVKSSKKEYLKEPESGSIRLKRLGSKEDSPYRTSINAFDLLMQNDAEIKPTGPNKNSLQTNQKAKGLLDSHRSSADYDSNNTKAISEPPTDNQQEKISNYLISAVSSFWGKSTPTSASSSAAPSMAASSISQYSQNPKGSIHFDSRHRFSSERSSGVFSPDKVSVSSFTWVNDSDPDDAETDPSVSLLLNQIQIQNNALLNDPKSSSFAKQELKRQLQESRINMRKSGTEQTVDWEYWGALISDFENVTKKDPSVLIKNIYNGIPQEIRGTVWQLLSGSRQDSSLVHKYINMLDKPSPYDKAISRDLNRTFPEHEYFKQPGGPGQAALYNVLTVYAQYDQELGYCQGLAFVVGPLILNTPEEDAFCILERLMRVYNLRGHYLPNMELLQCRLYQFDKLFEEQFPTLFKHFNKEGIRSTMYMSKWLMTLFAFCLPMELVFRVFDLIFAEGVGVLLQISLAVLKRSQAMLLPLGFEQLIKCLSGSSLFEYYADRGSEAFIHDVVSIKAVTPKKMEKFAKEHATILAKNTQKASDLAILKEENETLSKEKNHILTTMQSLSKEHSELTSKYVQTKLELNMLADKNQKLEERVSRLEARLKSERQSAEDSLRVEMDALAKENLEMAKRCNDLDDRAAEVEAALVKVNTMYINSENDRLVLESKLNDLRKTLR